MKLRPPIHDAPMLPEHRVYVRVHKEIYRECQRLAKLANVKRVGAMARTLVEEGHQNGRAPAVVVPPSVAERWPMNVGFTEDQHAALVRGADALSRQVGQKIDLPAYVRRCLYRGLELRREKAAAAKPASSARATTARRRVVGEN